MPIEHDESKLPKWAQDRFAKERRFTQTLIDRLANVLAAHEILTKREWFVVPGPPFGEGEKWRYLWWLERENPRQACSLGPGDLLLVGRDRQRLGIPPDAAQGVAAPPPDAQPQPQERCWTYFAVQGTTETTCDLAEGHEGRHRARAFTPEAEWGLYEWAIAPKPPLGPVTGAQLQEEA